MSATVALDAPRPGRFSASRAASFGVLWSIAATALTMLDAPLYDIGNSQVLAILVRVLPTVLVQGLILAVATSTLERQLTLARGIAFTVAFALLTAPLDGFFWVVLPLPGANDLPAWAILPQYPHGIWQNLLAGGLFVTAFSLNAASERGRHLFAQAEIARQQTEAWLGAERVRALQGHVDPALLLRVMAEVERRYVFDAAAAQRLLDALVGMLRAAMPGVRSGTSTLASEVLLARQYAALRAELEPGRTTWTVRVDGVLPELPFPPLLLLPVLDQLIAPGASVNAACGPAELHLAVADEACTLRLVQSGQGLGPWLAPDLSYRLQVGLRAVFGEAWVLDVHELPSAHALVLTLPLPKAAAISSTFPNLLEVTHE